jgi:hypothetical protein
MRIRSAPGGVQTQASEAANTSRRVQAGMPHPHIWSNSQPHRRSASWPTPGRALRQPQPGVHLWRSPHGYRYRVDNTGTHALGKTAKPHRDSPLETALARIIDTID